MSKPKVAFYWCASCGGCEETVVDLAEDILGVVAAVDIVLWPCAMDFKKADIEAAADKSIVAAFINGAVRTTEQEEWVRLLRRKGGPHAQRLQLPGQPCQHEGECAAVAGPGQWARRGCVRHGFRDVRKVRALLRTAPRTLRAVRCVPGGAAACSPRRSPCWPARRSPGAWSDLCSPRAG